MKCSWDSFGWDKVPTCVGALKGTGKPMGKLGTFEEFLIWETYGHSYEILGAGMLWKPKEARILTNFIDQPVNIR